MSAAGVAEDGTYPSPGLTLSRKKNARYLSYAACGVPLDCTSQPEQSNSPLFVKRGGLETHQRNGISGLRTWQTGRRGT